LRQRRAHGEEPGGLEPELGGLQVGERPDHQAGADEQHQRGRHLCHHQRIARKGTAAGPAAAALLQRVVEGRARGVNGGHDAEDEAGGDRQPRGEREQRRAQTRCRRQREHRRNQPGEQAHGRGCDDEPEQPSCTGQHH
jgi:hypothetical protein